MELDETYFCATWLSLAVRVPTLREGVKKGFRLLDELTNFDSPSDAL